MSENNLKPTSEDTKNEVKKGACPICGFITPFDPEIAGFCCPVCGAPSGQNKK